MATATVKNFVLIAKDWFGLDFSESLSLVLPLSFVPAKKEVEAVVVTRGEQRLLSYLQALAASEPEKDSPFDIAVRVQVKFERSKLSTATKVQVTNDPNAVKVFLTEQDIRERYPWDYATLCAKCGERYSDFKQTAKFHELRKPLRDDARLIYSRYLDPNNLKSGRPFVEPCLTSEGAIIVPILDPRILHGVPTGEN